ncbi:hypothetical protein [Mycolicibacterium hodleri]|uniref:Uncharacterized protein n=1 Tax=Mycolicibacterium hodleri TaxID=49897 RepID=A0A502EB79_9MYCO|nr:hypothetical protein [Mycolicibacterium hodleri]TPG34229.1 hypothetical protein EAH80_11565 [Mycolicibacterium hodleri]
MGPEWDPRRFRKAILAVAMSLALVAVGVSGCASHRNSTEPSHLFAADGPWRRVIASNPELDPNSAAMIAAVQPTPQLFANLVQYGIPVYASNADTPTQAVNCTKLDYGICPFAGWPVPIPSGAQPNSGSDAVMVTVDEAAGISFEFWRAFKRGDEWSTSFAAVNSIRGSGWGGAATGSGASRLAGVVRISDIAAGRIEHALALQTNNACTTFRSPALKSDGRSGRDDCIPEGARLQLDPAIDLSTLKLTSGELAVATAMQRYGGYVMDVGAAPLSVSFERDDSATSNSVGKTYQEAGFRWDYDAMEHIPWNELRVLK